MILPDRNVRSFTKESDDITFFVFIKHSAVSPSERLNILGWAAVREGEHFAEKVPLAYYEAVSLSL